MGGSSPARLLGTFSGPKVTLTGCQDKPLARRGSPKYKGKTLQGFTYLQCNYSQCVITSYKLGSSTLGLHAWFNVQLAFTYTAACFSKKEKE